MSFGFRVLQVERAAERFERVVVRLLKLCERSAQLRGAFFDQLLKISLIVAVFRNEAPVLQRPPDPEKQLILLKWLQNVVVGSAANRFEGRRDVVNGRDH